MGPDIFKISVESLGDKVGEVFQSVKQKDKAGICERKDKKT